jgi:16S rRNA A1518/A1519 N6-dimethyltransferase RsmA/KsgA/DIM1 with predicted DNA glycosylase/AP lyase activity
MIEITETKHGQMVVLSNDTFISRSLIEYGEWTEAEFTVMAQALQPGDHVVDIGANLGALTVAFARKVAPGGMVYAFEPQPRIFRDQRHDEHAAVPCGLRRRAGRDRHSGDRLRKSL